MRQILIQRARARRALKRGGAPARVTLDDERVAPDRIQAGFVQADQDRHRDIDVLALDEALHRLAELDETLARLVELRYFGGLTIEETAEVLGTSPATVKRQWTLARVWLKRALEEYRVLLLDQRGTGRSTPANRQTLARRQGTRRRDSASPCRA